MTWTVIVARLARKQLLTLPPRDQDKVAAAVRAIAENPLSGDVVKLEGEKNAWRRRVGSYRIFFNVDGRDRRVSIDAIVRRTSTTY